MFMAAEDAQHATGSDGPERSYSKSLQRGVEILKCFTTERRVIGIAELAELLHGSRSTTHRYATTLVELGYLEQDASRKYRLATRATDIGLAAIGALPIHQHARPVLEDLRLQTNYTVSLGILDEDRALCLYVLHGSRPGQHAVDLDLGVGSRGELHCTAIGKTLLAHIPDSQQDALIARMTLSKQGPNSITSKKALREALAGVREAGLAVDDQESAAGAVGVAVPLLAGDGEVVGGIGLLAPRSAGSVEEMRSAHLAALLDAAARLGVLLG
jgi:IclR family pca regulon transcriptional regulator